MFEHWRVGILNIKLDALFDFIVLHCYSLEHFLSLRIVLVNVFHSKKYQRDPIAFVYIKNIGKIHKGNKVENL